MTLRDAIKDLKAAGWRHILSAMCDSLEGTDYGMLFILDENPDDFDIPSRRFWLNIETLNQLPIHENADS